MIASDAVRGLPRLRFSPSHTCSSCHLGKHARTRMPKTATHRASQILELVHSDVCGPFKTNSTGGARYFITFVDDFSRKLWIYFISQKSQVLEKFQHFVQLMRTSTGKTVQTLRTDNGGEYTSRAFNDFCATHGIARELIPPYTPEHNGVAERRNRSILDITRCLLLDKALPGHLWGEAVKAAVDILNLRSTKQHPDKTPEELFSGKKPSITHLRIFGSSVFVHIPKASRTKLEPRSEKCILLSFDLGARAYRCYRPSTKKIFVSRDITIHEDHCFSPPPPTASIHHPSPALSFVPGPTSLENSKVICSSPPVDPPLPSSPTLSHPLELASPTATSTSPSALPSEPSPQSPTTETSPPRLTTPPPNLLR